MHAALGLGAAFAPLTAASEAPAVGAFAALDREMQRLVADGKRAGIVYGVMQHGQLMVLEAHGLRDIEKNLPMQTDSVFRLYSQSRAVTAAAILTLVDAGQLSLDAPVARYLPEIGAMRVISALRGATVAQTEPQRRPMTVRQLFNYTSGLGYAADWPAGAAMRQRDILRLDGTLAEMITKLSAYPLLYQPGQRWVYGFHSDVLGRIAEVVSGQSFDVFLDERLLAPIGMRDTGFFVRAGQVDRLAAVYGPDSNGRLAPRPAVASSSYTQRDTLFSAGGGLVSTVPDYLRFGQMLLNGGAIDNLRVLRASTVRAMTRNALTPVQGGEVNWYRYQPAALFRGYGWGLGIGVRLPDRVHTVPGSDGDLAWGGLASTTYFIDPKEQIVAVAMSQYLGPGVDDLGFILREGVYAGLCAQSGAAKPCDRTQSATPSRAGR